MKGWAIIFEDGLVCKRQEGITVPPTELFNSLFVFKIPGKILKIVVGGQNQGEFEYAMIFGTF